MVSQINTCLHLQMSHLSQLGNFSLEKWIFLSEGYDWLFWMGWAFGSMGNKVSASFITKSNIWDVCMHVDFHVKSTFILKVVIKGHWILFDSPNYCLMHTWTNLWKVCTNQPNHTRVWVSLGIFSWETSFQPFVWVT